MLYIEFVDGNYLPEAKICAINRIYNEGLQVVAEDREMQKFFERNTEDGVQEVINQTLSFMSFEKKPSTRTKFKRIWLIKHIHLDSSCHCRYPKVIHQTLV